MSFILEGAKKALDAIKSIIPKGCTPADCETSEQAFFIAKNLETIANARDADWDGPYGAVNLWLGGDAHYSAADFYKRGEELKRQGK